MAKASTPGRATPCTPPPLVVYSYYGKACALEDDELTATYTCRPPQLESRRRRHSVSDSVSEHIDTPKTENQLLDELEVTVARLTSQVRIAIQALGPSSVLFEIEQTVESLKRIAADSEKNASTTEQGQLDRVAAHDEPEQDDHSTAMRLTIAKEELTSRLTRNLESSLGQLITNAITELEYAIPLVESDPAVLQQGMEHLKGELQEGREALRWLIADLRPPHLLADLGLGPSLIRYAERFAQYSGLTIQTDTLGDFHRRLPASVELGVFRIVQEALKNVHQHANASLVRIEFESKPPTLTFIVEDDGEGFEQTHPTTGLGLIGMKERAQAIDGTFHILTQTGAGTTAIVSVPAPKAVSDTIE